MAILALYTSSFPFGKSETFLETEILYLSKAFEEIIIIPFQKSGAQRTLPANVKVRHSDSSKIKSRFRQFLYGLVSYLEYSGDIDLRNRWNEFKLFKRIRYIGYAVLCYKRLKKLLPVNASLHYSYWLDLNAYSLSMLVREGLIESFVCRAHGYDLYDERGENILGFLRSSILHNTTRIYFISNHGREYTRMKFPLYEKKYVLSRLGTSDPGCQNPEPDKESLTFVSCSAVDSNKRLDYIVRSLEIFKDKYPATKIFWHHFGDGELLEELRKRISYTFSDSLISCNLKGHITNTSVFEFYKNCSVDFILNVSKSEGIPVSLMEANSFSIPAIAPAVGGIPEIVNQSNGVLLPEDFNPHILADIFWEVISNKDKWIVKRLKARKDWEALFNSGTNYVNFVDNLVSLFGKDVKNKLS